MGAPPTTPPGQPPPERPGEREGLAFQTERQMVGARAITFRTDALNPPSMLYVSADDGLFVNCSNLQAGQVLTLASQFLLPDGRLQPMVWSFNPPATGAQTAYLFPLAEGYLFNLTCTPIASTRRGNTWVYAAIRRGSLTAGNNLQTLLQDYVDSYGGPTWPGGQLRASSDGTGLLVNSYVGTLAVNTANYTYTVPAYARVRIRAITVSLQTSATAGNRGVAIWLSDPTNLMFLDAPEPVLAASTYYTVYWALLLGWSQNAFYNASMVRGLPDIILNPGQTIKINSTMQTGDQLQNINFVLEQWFSF